MPRRRDALRHLMALSEMGATPAQRLVTMVVLAHADANDQAEISARQIGELCQYGTRHVQQTLKELQDSGILVKVDTAGNTNCYKVQTTNPRPLCHDRKIAQVTIEDVIDLARHHACVMGLEVPQYSPDTDVQRAVSEAIGIYGREKCEIAHHGHKYRVDRFEQEARFKSFKFAYPTQDGRLNREWFESIISDGREAHRQAKNKKLKERREQLDREQRERERARCRTESGREIGKARAREILQQLGARTPTGGPTKAITCTGGVRSVGSGQAVASGVGSAEPQSGSSD